VRKARGVEVEDVDGNTYIDFCFGDTGAMFGHSPPAIARALAETGAMGITSMLPPRRVARVGEKLAKLFGLPFWQMTQTATDANRAALRWARAITGGSASWCSTAAITARSDETLVRALPKTERQGWHACACRPHRHEPRRERHHRRGAVQRHRGGRAGAPAQPHGGSDRRAGR
jgi:glutamate-1-semialdehyde aminotransferase